MHVLEAPVAAANNKVRFTRQISHLDSILILIYAISYIAACHNFRNIRATIRRSGSSNCYRRRMRAGTDMACYTLRLLLVHNLLQRSCL